MSRFERGLRRAFFAALVSLLLWPLLSVAAALWPGLRPLERTVAYWFDLHCHRDPSRTPLLLGIPLGVCARCSGIYFGLGLGAALRWPKLSPNGLRFWVLGGAALMLADIAVERHGVHGSWMGARLFTGLLLAYPVGVAVGVALRRSNDLASVQRP